MKRIGRFEIVRQLGQGSFGCVYLATDPASNRSVAIKVASDGARTNSDSSGRLPKEPLCGDPDVARNRRLLAEGRSLIQLDHPGIVSVMETGRDGEFDYLVSEYITGPDLETALQAKSFSWRQAVRIVVAVADALEHAHAHRVIHRDIKPANIILTEADRPILVDFDLAVDEMSGAENVKGDLAGTLAYMSPEQVIGEGHRLDGRTDIYSLAVVLYRMLTGRLPFHSEDSTELKRQIREDDPQPLRQLVPSLPVALESICLKALSKDYPDRQTTAGDIATQLRGLLTSKLDASDIALPATETSRSLGVVSSTDGSSFKRRRSQSSRQRVTVVRCDCDVFESTVIASKLDLEEQNDLLDEFRELCRSIIQRYGGTSAQLTEQGLLACFGFPIASENATQNAVRAGLEIQTKMKLLADRTVRRYRVPVSAKIALHTDEAVLQVSTDSEVVMSGRVLTLVGKIIVPMPNDCVFVSESVRRLVEDFFDFVAAGQLEGGTDRWLLHRTIGHRASSRFEVAALSGELTPLTGRDREVRGMVDSWQSCCDGNSRFIALCGSPGIGKSRLIHELKVRAESATPGNQTLFIQWRTSPQLQNTAFAPVIECFERTLHFGAEPKPIKRLSRIVQYLDDLEIEGDEEVGLIAGLLSVPLAGCYPELALSPTEKKQKTLDLLFRWLRACASQRPVLFAIEDLHWADPSTLEFILGLAVQDDCNRVLTLATYRPEFQSKWPSQSNLTEITLERLTRNQLQEMLAGRLGGLDVSQKMIDHLDAKTDGVPLFIEEFATTLLADSTDEKRTASLDERRIPDSLQELLMARLQRTAGDIELVQLGAAIGREFGESLLSATSNRDPEALRDELARLVDSDLLYVVSHGTTRTYAFKHALIQDAAYLALTRSHRRVVHANIAETIERQFEDLRKRKPEILAMHYSLANRPEKAVQYWEEAGQQATERGANLEAQQHLSQAIEQLPRLTEDVGWTDLRRERHEVKLRVMLGVHLQLIHGYSAPEIFDNYEKAVQASERLGDPMVKAPLLYGLFRSDLMIGKLHRARKLADQLSDLAMQADQAALTVISLRAVGCIAFFFGDFDQSRRSLERLLEFEPTPELLQSIHQFDPVDPWIAARSYLTVTLWMLGYPDQSLSLAEETIQLANRDEKAISLIFITGFSQWVHQFRGDIVRTVKTCDRSDELGEKYGFPFWNAWTMTIRGWTMDAGGNSLDAISVLQSGMQQWKNAAMGRSYFLVLLGQACLNAKQLDAAQDALDDADQNAEQTGEWFYAAETTRMRGELALRHDPPDQHSAEQLFRQALQQSRKQDAKSLQLRAACSLARLQFKQGNGSAAEATLGPVLDWFQEGHGTADLQEAEQLISQIRS